MIVTSFGPDGYDLYGRAFIETYLLHENDILLIVYVEGQDQLVQVESDFPAVIVRDLLAVHGVDRILKEISANPLMCGHTKDQEGKAFHTWRLDANRYCRKSFAFHDAINQAKSDSGRSVVCWIDADVTFHAKLPEGFESVVLPGDKAISYLGRDKMHSETGFMAVDANHPKTNLFLALYWGLYATGSFVHLREWHDCYVFDHAMMLSTTPAYNLSVDPSSLYPFDTSVLSNWMTHNKGPARKSAVYGGDMGDAEDER